MPQQTMRVSHVKTYDEDGRIRSGDRQLTDWSADSAAGRTAPCMKRFISTWVVAMRSRFCIHICAGNQQAVARFVAEGQTANRPGHRCRVVAVLVMSKEPKTVRHTS